MIDVVYRVRPGDDNEALRYSLRSLRNVVQLGRVMIVGDKPSWVRGVTYCHRDQEGLTDLENSNLNLRLALDDPDLSDNFIVMDDDFYFLRPTLKIPAMHQGLLQQRIATYRAGNRFQQAYSLITTARELRRLGVGVGQALLSYELHIPMIYNKRALKRMFELTKLQMIALRPRTLYGNMYQLRGELTADAKESSNTTSGGGELIGRYLSTGSGDGFSASRGRLSRRFPDSGPYEQGVIPRGGTSPDGS